MGILKNITEEYFGETVREEDMIDLTGLDVEIVSFTDNNKKFHKTGYKPKNKDNLKKLLKRMIEVRGDNGDFNDIDTSDITYMSELFNYNKTFNGDITGWNVSGVKSMYCMFHYAKSFNRPIGDWNVSNVEDMGGMFHNAISFNQPIGNWKFLKARSIGNMFYNAESFNQPIGDWNVSGVTDMTEMFKNATSFNQDLSKWNLTKKYTENMFDNCPIKDEYKPKMK